jgi:hypothetical protein
MSASAFLSQAREDEAFAQRLRSPLLPQGIVAHGDWELVHGVGFQEQLEEMIRHCDVVICIMSPDWPGSSAYLDETILAEAMGKRIIPISLRSHGDDNAIAPCCAPRNEPS